MKLKPSEKYVAVVEVLKNGKLKIQKARQLVPVDASHSTWKQIDSRNFARAINTSNLVIK